MANIDDDDSPLSSERAKRFVTSEDDFDDFLTVTPSEEVSEFDLLTEEQQQAALNGDEEDVTEETAG